MSQFKIRFCDLTDEAQRSFLDSIHVERDELDNRYLTGEWPIATCSTDNWTTADEFFKMVRDL